MRHVVRRTVLSMLCASAIVLPAVAAQDESVVLINPFEVKAGQEAECLAMWHRAADFLRAKPGFRSTVLHQSLAPNARYHYVNVAVWDSAKLFQAAVSDPAFRQLIATDACTGHPALYAVALSQTAPR